MSEDNKTFSLYEVILSCPDELGDKPEISRGVYVVAHSEENARYQLEQLSGKEVTIKSSGDRLVGFGPANITKLLH